LQWIKFHPEQEQISVANLLFSFSPIKHTQQTFEVFELYSKSLMGTSGFE